MERITWILSVNVLAGTISLLELPKENVIFLKVFLSKIQMCDKIYLKKFSSCSIDWVFGRWVIDDKTCHQTKIKPVQMIRKVVKQGKRSALQIRYIMWNKWNKKDTTWWKRWDKTNSLSNGSTMIIEPFDNTTCFYLSLKRKYQKKHTRQWQTETSDHLIKSHKQVVRSWQKEWKETKRWSVMKNMSEMKRIKSVTSKKQLLSRLHCTYFFGMVFTISSFAVV